MLGRRVVSALSLLIVVSGVGVLVATGSAGAAPPASTKGKTYVALGDSYAAGYGLPVPSTPTGKPVAGCEQTTGDYPHILAGQLGLTLTDVACSGATTVDFFHPQDVTGPKPPRQLDIFKTVQPDLVTITIGGNDLGFTSIAGACLAATPSGPVNGSGGQKAGMFSTCQAYFADSGPNGGRAANPYDKLPGVIAKVKAAIAAVQKAAPKAKIAVIAYPAIAPNAANTPAAGCFTSLLQTPSLQRKTPSVQNLPPSALPFTNTDIPYLQLLQQDLDAGIGQAAKQLGASYADIYPSSLPHSACQPENVRWVEPVTPGDGGTNVLHPNLAGTNAMAAALNPVVRRLFAAPAAAPSSTTSSTSQGSAGSGASSSTSSEPLAATGTSAPVGGTLALGALLIAAGSGLLCLTSRTGRRRTAHVH